MNETLKRIVKYKKDARLREEDGIFVVEGLTMLSETPKEQIETLVYSETFSEESSGALTALIENVPNARSFKVSDSDFKKLSDTMTPRGILGVVKRPELSMEVYLSKDNGLFVLLENLQDPGNLGTIIRSMEAASGTAVFLNETSVDPYNPKVVRSTMGSIFRVPVFVVPDFQKLLKEMKDKNITLCAAELRGSESYDSLNYRKPTAFLIGNEAHGLSEETIRCADRRVKIPMGGRVESLNAAMAATILMFEASRQRRS